MRKVFALAAATLVLVLLSAPVLADSRIISDKFNPTTGEGVAVVKLGHNHFATIAYRDMDGTQSFTARDTRLKVSYFRLRPPFAKADPDQPRPLR